MKLTRAILEGAAAGAALAAPAGAEASAMGGALGGLANGVRLMAGLGVRHFATNGADKRLLEVNERFQAAALEEYREKVEEKLGELSEAVGEREAASSVAPILASWNSAWQTAEGKKQRVIMAALVSAFDPESHEQAMTQRYFRLIETLDYPELYELCQLYDDPQVRKAGFDSWLSFDGGSPGSKFGMALVAFARHDLVRLPDGGGRSFAITWLGKEFAAFLRRGGFRQPEAGSDEEKPADGVDGHQET